MAENWTLTDPVDHTKVGSLPDEIRNVKTLVVSGAARIFNQSAAPSTRYDGSDFTADDDGSIWIDTDNNKVYIMTDWDAAAAADKWTSIESVTIATLLAAARVFAFADATLTLQNTDHEDTDGGRQSRLIFKGEQSGGEVTTLGYIEASHDGSSDDQKGNLKIVLNDGDDDDSPSVTILDINSTEAIAKQAHTNGAVPTLNDSDPTAMLPGQAYRTQGPGFVTAYTKASSNLGLAGYVGTTNDPEGAGALVAHSRHSGAATIIPFISFFVGYEAVTGIFFEVTCGSDVHILWTPLVPGGAAPIDQD